MQTNQLYKSKSEVWAEIKRRELNSETINWKTNVNVMRELLLQNDQLSELQQELNQLTKIQNIFDTQTKEIRQKVKDNNAEQMKVESYNQLIDLVKSQTSFPVYVQYKADGQSRYIRISNINQLDAFEEKLLVSDAMDFDITDVQISFKDQRQFQLIKKSKIGQGNDFYQIQESDNEHFYIPTSNNCLRKCLQKALGDSFDLQKFNQFCESQKIVRDKFPQCKLRQLGSSLGYNIGVYCRKDKKVKNMKNPDIVVFVHDGHYILLKSVATKHYDAAIQSYNKLGMVINDVDLDVQEYKAKIMTASLTEQLQNVYAWDIEAYQDKNNNNKFIPYAVGLLPIKLLTDKDGNIVDNDKIQQRVKYVKQFHKEQCIEDMVKYLDQKHKKTIVEKNGKKQTMKQTIYLYAHNAKGFDNLLVHEQQNLKFTNIVKKNGISSLTVECQNVKIVFKDSMTHLIGSLDKNYKNFKLPDMFAKQSMNHDLITKHNYMDMVDEWKQYLDYDIVSLSLVWISYTRSMFDVLKKTNEQGISKSIDVRQCLSSAQLSFQVFMQDNQIPLHQFQHPFAKQYIRNAVHGGRVCAYKKKFRSSIYDQLCKLYKTNNIDEIMKNQNKDLNKQLLNDDILMAFDATSLYPSAMKQAESFPDMQSARHIGQDFDVHTNKHYIINCDIYLPPVLKFIPVPYKKDGMCYYQSGNLRDQTYNDIDIKEVYRFGGYVTKIHSGIVFDEKIENPFNNFVNLFFELRNKYKQQGADSLQNMCKLILNSCYGKTVQKDLETKCKYTTQLQFQKEIYDENIVDYEVLQNGDVYYETKKESKNSYPSILGCYILAYSKRIMNDFIISTDSHLNSNVYYTDTDSIYIPLSLYQSLKCNNHVGSNLGQGKNDYGDGGIIYGDFLGPKQKLCYTINESGQIEKHITFKGIERQQQNQMDCADFQQLGDQQLQENPELKTTTISRWQRKTTDGVYYKKDNMIKKISALPQLKKMKLIGNEYQIICNE